MRISAPIPSLFPGRSVLKSSLQLDGNMGAISYKVLGDLEGGFTGISSDYCHLRVSAFALQRDSTFELSDGRLQTQEAWLLYCRSWFVLDYRRSKEDQ